MKYLFRKYSVWFLAAPILCYLVSLFILSNLTGQNINDIVVFGGSYKVPIIGNCVILLTYVGGLTGVFLCPGLLGIDVFNIKSAGGLQKHVYAFLISLALLEFIIFALREVVPGEVTRSNLILSIAVITMLAAGYIFFLKKEFYVSWNGFTTKNISIIIAYIGCAALLFMFFQDKFFAEVVNEDGFLLYEAGFELQQGRVYEELTETAYMKAVMGMTLLSLFGKAYTSMRVPYFFILGLISMVSLAIVHASNKIESKKPDFIVLGHAILFTVFMFFQKDWGPYSVDVIHVTSDMYFLLLSLCFTYTLISKRYGFTLLSFALMFQSANYAIVLTSCMLISYWIFFKEERRDVNNLAVRILVVGAIGVLLILMHAWHFQYLNKWPGAIWDELLMHIFAKNITISHVHFITKYILLVGGLPIAMIFIYRQEDKINKCLNLAALSYFLILLFFIKDKSLHLLMPLAFLPVISFLRWVYVPKINMNRIYALRIIHVCILILCVILLWPYQYIPADHLTKFWSKVQIVTEKKDDLYYIEGDFEHAVEDILTKKGLFYLSIGNKRFYSQISDNYQTGYDYYVTDNLKLITGEVIVLGNYEHVFFLGRNGVDLDQIRNQHVMSAEERYVPNYEHIMEKYFKI